MVQKSEEGFELTWAVNVMAPFLLTSLLLDTVKSRIVNVSSISSGSSLDFGNLQQVLLHPFQHEVEFAIALPFGNGFQSSSLACAKMLNLTPSCMHV